MKQKLAALAITSTFLLNAGCGVGAQPPDTPASGKGATNANSPSISGSFEIEHFMDGVNKVKESYEARVANCERIGLPTIRLSPQDVAKVGKERIDVAFDANHSLERRTIYDLRTDFGGPVGAPRKCDVSIHEKVYETYRDQSSQVLLDVDGDDKPVVTREPRGSTPIHAIAAEGSEPDTARASRQQGWTGPTKDVVAGQPCLRWNRSEPHPVSICLLSGGEAYGLSDLYAQEIGLASPLNPFSNSIILEQKAPGGLGSTVRTLSIRRGPLSPADLTLRASGVGQ